ncbi:MAG: DNA-binding response regulator [Variovorax sp.]|nr:DNA-binding response regulator [Variovorax sp.]
MQLLVATLTAQAAGDPGPVVCTQFTSARALRSALEEDIPFDLLILDYNYEQFGGLALLRWLRDVRKSKVPVIMLSQRSSERDIAESLTAGADDFVAKPLRPMEMRARVERFRPKPNTNGWAETFGNWTFFHDRALVTLSGSPDQIFDLSEREFSLATALFRNLGRIVSRYELLEATHQAGRAMNTRILDNQVFKVRRTLAFEANGLNLQTIYGQGYRLSEANTHGVTSPPRNTPSARHGSGFGMR